MVALVGGNSVGLSLSTLTTLGQRGVWGQALQGRSGETAFVNVATGNVTLQDRDEQLVGHGLAAQMVRTYNSQGNFPAASPDHWAFGVYLKTAKLNGQYGKSNSRITRTDQDGAEATYTWDATRALYISTAGGGAHDTIRYDAPSGSYVWADGDSGITERYEASASGRLQSITDASGNTVSYGYNSNGTVASVTDASGEVTTFVYSGQNITQVRTQAQKSSGLATLTRVRYDYDSLNRLWHAVVDLSPEDNSVTDGQVYTSTYTYEGTSSRIQSVTQTDGTSIAFTYVQVAGSYRVATFTDGLKNVTRFDYDTAARKTTVTDPLGLVTTYEYDAAGQLLRVTGPAIAGGSQVTSFAYDVDGNLTQLTDALGNALTMLYDANGNQTLQRDVLGNTVTRTFTAANKLATEAVYLVPDPDGAGAGQPTQPLTSRYVYDASNLLRFAISAEGRVTEYRYASTGERLATVQYGAAAYDVSALSSTAVPSEAQMSSWAGAQDKTRSTRSDMAYDFRGQLKRTTTYTQIDANGNGIVNGSEVVTTYVYDQAGQLLNTIEAANNAQTTYAYDGLGRVRTALDAQGNTTVTTYDDAHNATSVRLVNGLVTTSSYDGAGRLINVQQSDAAARVLGKTRYDYDADGRLLMTVDATGVRHHMLYDAAGRKVADVDGNGTLTEYRYDKDNQVTCSVHYATPVNLAQLIDGNGKPLNPPLSSLLPTKSPRDQANWWIYDAAGRLVKTVNAAGAVSETRYDGAGRAIAVLHYVTPVDISGYGNAPTFAQASPGASADDRVARQFYDQDGLLSAALDAEGDLVEYRYDARGARVATIGYAKPTDVGLRAAGTLPQLLANLATSDDIKSYTLYNARGQVNGEVSAEGYLTELVYDGNGNLARQVRYATRVSYTAGAQLQNVRPLSSAQDQVQQFGYTSLHQLATQIDAFGVQTTYRYDNVGHLVETTRAYGSSEVRTLNSRFDAQGRLIGELSGEGSALLTGNLTSAQIDDIWSRYGSSYTYDAAGRRTSATDANGLRTLFFYDADNQLTHTVNALGEVELRDYNTLGQLKALSRLATRLTAAQLAPLAGGVADAATVALFDGLRNASADTVLSYTYNTTGTLATQLDALGNETRYEYDAFDQEKSRSTPVDAGHRTLQTQSYDRCGLLERVTADDGGIAATTRLEYDAFGRVTSSFDAAGKEHKQSYDKLGRVVSTTDPLQKSRFTTYDAFDRVLTQRDALGQTTTYTYDDAARSVTVTTPEGVVLKTVRNRHGQTDTVTDNKGNQTHFRYDRNGNLVETTTPLTSDTRSYDHADRLIDTVDRNGNVVHYDYDNANRVLKRTVDPSELKLVTTYAYDAKGQAVLVTDANQVDTRTEFDRKGQVKTQTVDPNGLALKTQYDYDARGQVLLVTLPNGTATKYVYDALGRRTEEHVDPNGLDITRRYGYDAQGNLRWSRDGNQNITRYVYDDKQRLIATLDAAGSLTLNSYDDEDRLVKSVTASEAVDLSGLPEQIGWSDLQSRVQPHGDSDRAELRRYDRDGRLSFTVDAAGGVQKLVYDENGNVAERIAYATPVAVTGNEDASWLPAPRVSMDDRHVRNVYDKLNRLSYSADGIGAVTHFEYDGNGNVTLRKVYATQLTSGKAPDQASASVDDRVTEQVYDKAGRLAYAIDAKGYVTATTYDGVGRVKSTVLYNLPIDGSVARTVQALGTRLGQPGASDRGQSFDYDKAGRLKSSTDALQHTEYFEYDGAGNKTQFRNKNGAVWTYEYDKANRLTIERAPMVEMTTFDDASGTFKTDANAQLVTQLGYDGAGRLTSRTEAVGRPEHRTTRYEYDAVGRQVKTIYPAVNVYSGESAAALAANGMNGLASAIEAGRELFTQTIYNALGDAVAGIDVAGAVSVKAYDKAGRVRYEVDALGHVTGYQRNIFGETEALTRYASAQVVVPSNLSSAAQAPTLGQIEDTLRTANPTDDRVLKNVYDLAGRVVQVTEPKSYVYDSDTGQYGNAAKVTRKEYNAFGELTLESVLRNSALQTPTDTRHYYDKRGQQSAVVDAMGYLTTYGYDAAGNLTASTEYDNALAAGTWDERSTPAGTDNDRSTEWRYDNANRKTAEVRKNVEYGIKADGTRNKGDLTTTYGYDAVGNLTRTTDAAGGNTYSYYDALGRVKAVAAPRREIASLLGVEQASPFTEFKRDAYGNVVVQIEYARGSIDATEAGGTGQGTLFWWPGLEVDRKTYTRYDSHGHAVQTTDAEGVNHYSSYNARGQIAKRWQGVTGSDGQQHTLFQAYQYDALGQLTHTLDPASTMRTLPSMHATDTHSVDANGLTHRMSVSIQPASVIDPNGGTVRLQYDYELVGPATGPRYETEHDIQPGDFSVDVPAAQAMSGISRSWVDGTPTTGYTYRSGGLSIWQRDAQGNWVQCWTGTITSANQTQIVELTQAQAGVDDTALEYNAFGELTAKRINGQEGEYFEYDHAGHVVHSNGGDGADKIFLYDLQGHNTAEIRSQGSGGSNVDLSAKSINIESYAQRSDMRRTDMHYDALGRVVTQLLPDRLQAANGGATVHNGGTAASIAGSAHLEANVLSGFVGYPLWTGDNQVQLWWPSLAGLGGGDVKVEIDYLTAAHDGVPATAAKHVAVLTAEEGASGALVSWKEPGGDPVHQAEQPGGIGKITHLRIWKQDANGEWQPVADQNEPGKVASWLEIAAPADPDAVVEMMVRPVGSTSEVWNRNALTNFGGSLRYKLDYLDVGRYEYSVRVTDAHSSESHVMASGTLEVAVPPVAPITTALTFMGGVLSWASPGDKVVQTLRIRGGGSSGTWINIPIMSQGTGIDGAKLSALAEGDYDVELVWTRAGEAAPFKHAVGVVHVAPPPAPGPKDSVPPIPVHFDPVTKVLSWSAPPAPADEYLPTTTAHLRLRMLGGDWSEQAIAVHSEQVITGTNQGDPIYTTVVTQSFDFSVLAAATYDVELEFVESSIGLLTQHATAVIIINDASGNHYELQSQPVTTTTTVTPPDPNLYASGKPVYGAPVVTGHNADGTPIYGTGYSEQNGVVVATPYWGTTTVYHSVQKPVTKQIGEAHVILSPAVYSAPVVIGYDANGAAILGKGYVGKYESSPHDELVPVQVPDGTQPVYVRDGSGNLVLDESGHPVPVRDESGNIVTEPKYKTVYVTQSVVENVLVGVEAVPYTEVHTRYEDQLVPVQVQVGTQPVYVRDGSGNIQLDDSNNPIQARDESGNLVYEPIYETQLQLRPVPIDEYVTITPEDPAHFLVSAAVYQRDADGNLVTQPIYETQIETVQEPEEVPAWITPEDPRKFIVGWEGTPTYGPPVIVLGEDGTPVLGDDGLPVLALGYERDANGIVTAHSYEESQTHYEQLPVLVTGGAPGGFSFILTTPGDSDALPGGAGRLSYTASADPGTAVISEAPTTIVTGKADIDGESHRTRPTITQTFDRWGNLLTTSDPRYALWKTSFTYNANNQLIEQQQPTVVDAWQVPVTPLTRIYYDELGRQVAVIDANDHRNSQVFDAGGNLIREEHADGGVVTHRYDGFGQRVYTLDAVGYDAASLGDTGTAAQHTTTHAYDKLGRLVTTTHGTTGGEFAVASLSASNMWNALALQLSTISETFQYDEAGRKTRQAQGVTQTGSGETTRYSYDLRGNVIATFLPLDGSAASTRSAYDAQGRKVAEIDGNKAAQTWAFDYFGQLNEHTDLGGKAYHYHYDKARQLDIESNDRGQDQRYTYDAAGQLLKLERFIQTDADDHAIWNTSNFAYDLAGRRVHEQTLQTTKIGDGEAATWVEGVYQDNHLSYDALGRLRNVHDDRLSVLFDYDAVGNRTHIHTHAYAIDDAAQPPDEAVAQEDRWFRYDQMNRQIVVDGVNGAGMIDHTKIGDRTIALGHQLTYDKNGNRISDTFYGRKVTSPVGVIEVHDRFGNVGYYGGRNFAFQVSEENVTETYRYDGLNRLVSVLRDNTSQIDHRDYDAAGRVVAQGAVNLAAGWLDKLNEGLPTDQATGLERRRYAYDGDGRLSVEAVRKASGEAKYDVHYDGTVNGIARGYDGAGNVVRYAVVDHPSGGVYTEYTNTLARYEGYKEAYVVGNNGSSDGPGTTHDTRDVNGELIALSDSRMSENDRTFVNNVSGQVLLVNQGGHLQRQLVVNGEVLGRYGVGLDEIKPRSDDGKPLFGLVNGTGGDFSFGYARINANSPAAGIGSYTVQAGDTLQAIARSAYGDAGLWYRIAEANGITGDSDLRVGQTLSIPSQAGGVHNDAGTFRAYDPSKVVGDTSPNMPPPPVHGGGCGVIGMIIVIVIAIVVTVATYGEAAPEAAEFVAEASASGAAEAGSAAATTAAAEGGDALAAYVSASEGYVATAQTVANVGVAAMSAAAGSIASQLVGMAIGAQDKFSWNQVGLAAISGGVGAGLGGWNAFEGSATSFGNVAARQALGNALSQGISVATGLQPHFSWKAVAAAGASAGANALVDQVLQAQGTGAPAEAAQSRWAGVREVGEASLRGFATGLTTAVLKGGKVSLQEVATDSFGQALGNFIAYGGLTKSSQQTQALHQVNASLYVDNRQAAGGGSGEFYEELVRAFSNPQEVDGSDDVVVADASGASVLEQLRKNVSDLQMLQAQAAALRSASGASWSTAGADNPFAAGANRLVLDPEPGEAPQRVVIDGRRWTAEEKAAYDAEQERARLQEESDAKNITGTYNKFSEMLDAARRGNWTQVGFHFNYSPSEQARAAINSRVSPRPDPRLERIDKMLESPWGAMAWSATRLAGGSEPAQDLALDVGRGLEGAAGARTGAITSLMAARPPATVLGSRVRGAGRPSDLQERDAYRAYLDEKFGRTGDLDFDINTRGRSDIRSELDRLVLEGHAVGRHGQRVSDAAVDNRARFKWDPITGATTDYFTRGTHGANRNASKFLFDEALLASERYVRASPEFAAEKAGVEADGGLQLVVKGSVSLEGALGPSYKDMVFGRTRVGPVGSATAPIDFTDGTVTAVFRRSSSGYWNLHTLYPDPKNP